MTTPANPDDLITWLRAQLDDDERAAIETGASDHPAWHVVVTDEPSSPTPAQAAHIERHGPWRVLRRVAADRRILDEHRPSGQECRTCSGEPYMEETWDGEEERVTWKMVALTWPCPTVRLLFESYDDRPGYREEWRP